MGNNTDFLDKVYDIVSKSQRKWHIKNNIYTIVMCQGCELKPAVYSAKHTTYRCCSSECTKKLIGKKASAADHASRVKKMKLTMEVNLGKNPYGKIYEKLKQTNIKKYGVENPAKSERIKSIMNVRYLDTFINSVLTDEYKFISRNDVTVTLLHTICNNEFTIARGSFDCRKSINKELCTNCNPQFECVPEKEISEFLDSIGIAHIKRNRTIIKPYEIDIYIPEYRIAIEHNGIYWHSELFIDNKYHQNKRLACEKVGIHLISIWEDEWKYNKELIKSLISNFVGKSMKIGARKTEIRSVNTIDAKSFLNENHLQGYATFTYAYGLYYENRLIELMSFIKNKNGYELSRLCTKIGYSVQGGAKKLFTFFTNNHAYVEIVSFCDLTKFNGNVYRNLGYHTESYVKPTYYYMKRDGITIKRFHRRLFQKHLLVAKGADASKSEKQIMNEMGYFRIYNAGNKKFIYSSRS